MNLRSNANHTKFRHQMADLFATGWYRWMASNRFGPIAFAYRFGEVSQPAINDNSPQFPLLPLSTD